MKAKFREFFAKHQHLIVIALILAVILAAVTPTAIFFTMWIGAYTPKCGFPELKAEEVFRVTVMCSEHRTTELWSFCLALDDDRSLNEEERQAFCAVFNQAPTTQCIKAGGETLCSISVHRKQASVSGEMYQLLGHADGSYSLSGGGENWYITETSALAFLAYRRCEAEPGYLEIPRERVCKADDVVAATLYTWVKVNQPETVELTREQIEAFCAFLEERLLPEAYSYRRADRLRNGNTGWQVILTKQDGSTWYVQYNDGQGGLSLSYQIPEGKDPAVSVGYTCQDEAAVAALPELLETVP